MDKNACEIIAATLYRGFAWDKSPEGYQYWRERALELAKFSGVDEVFQLPIDASLHSMAGSSRDMPADIWMRLQSLLTGAFMWNDTPQGHEYWAELNQRMAARAPKPAFGEPFNVKRSLTPGHIQAFLVKRGYKRIGSGGYSTVWAHKSDPDNVIKVAGRYDDWPEYIKWAEENGFAGTFAPKVKSLKIYKNAHGGNFYVAKVERLAEVMAEVKDHGLKATHNKLEKAMRGMLGGEGIGYHPDDLAAQLRAVAEKYYADKYGDVVKFGAAFRKHFRGASLDLHDWNFMTDKAGKRVVCTDPLTDQGFSSGRSPAELRIKSTEPVFAKAA